MWNETGSVRKDPGGKLNIAFVYPNTYWVGMSSLAVHTLYRLLLAEHALLQETSQLQQPRLAHALQMARDDLQRHADLLG